MFIDNGPQHDWARVIGSAVAINIRLLRSEAVVTIAWRSVLATWQLTWQDSDLSDTLTAHYPRG